MSLEQKVNEGIRAAMLARNEPELRGLRAIKAAVLLAKTAEGGKGELPDAEEIKLLQKLVKQRKDAAAIFVEQNRSDLAEPELAQAAVIEQFLPAQLSEADVEAAIKEIIAEGNFAGMQSMGQVMGLANTKLAGSADGKTISTIVKKLLTA